MNHVYTYRSFFGKRWNESANLVKAKGYIALSTIFKRENSTNGECK